MAEESINKRERKDSGEDLGSQIGAQASPMFSLTHLGMATGATTQPVGFHATKLFFGPKFV